ncbi:MAG TPA: toxin-activating lysine-acyltransferase [Paracoccaceae bacterium]|nr:toxin-activating lysine-acyltransferase [Paracoccaceae bacterium]
MSESASSEGASNGATRSHPAYDTKGLPTPEVLARIAALRAQVRESFGKIVMSLMVLPRYRHQTIADLQPLVLEPLIRDRIAIAYPAEGTDPTHPDIAGLAIWASVSAEVDVKIRTQIRENVFPVRLQPEDWTSGGINWLLDVIAPDRKAAGRVVANFKQVIKEGELRLHPVVAGQVDPEMMERMGARRGGKGEGSDAA